jgi:hypothetical protein
MAPKSQWSFAEKIIIFKQYEKKTMATFEFSGQVFLIKNT